MLKPIPYKIIKFHSDLSTYKLENLFGFFKVEVTTPKNLIYPLLPYKNEGLTIHPTGKFTGIYFSEELKAVQEQGYKIKLIDGYEFSKTNLFVSYIEHFYNIKKISKSLTFKEILLISKGKTMRIIIRNRFFKYLNLMNIKIKDTHLTVRKSENKIFK